jgi:hypothetical protein
VRDPQDQTRVMSGAKSRPLEHQSCEWLGNETAIARPCAAAVLSSSSQLVYTWLEKLSHVYSRVMCGTDARVTESAPMAPWQTDLKSRVRARIGIGHMESVSDFV